MKKIILILMLGSLFGQDLDSREIIEANNRFAINLYSQYKSEEGNIFFSPFSISTAMAMVYEGAEGKTAKEIKSVFGFPKYDNSRRNQYSNLLSEINKKDKEYALKTANALWAQQDFQFLDEYLTTVEKYYGGKTTNLDFKNEPDSSRLIINNWVEDKTNNKIKDLFPKGSIHSLTRLVLTNAIYFKAKWLIQFDADKTSDENFRVNPDKSIKVPMMQPTSQKSTFNYTQNKDLQILEMPYAGEDLSMLILLPLDDDIEVLENSFTIEKLTEWKKSLRKRRVKIYIPKFKFETKYFMKNTLINLGMPTAFTDSADFSGMTGTKDLKIDKVIHQAFIEVNEEGTEAAAATGIGMMMLTSLPPPTPIFKADHPFIFIIQQKDTGNILFMGRVSNPIN
ncbi:serpin family protein [Candidatus Marinimicrobia bacterium PRS2]|nr:serpin family protein [Candidatus Marinimicrobia bacterium PRS2]